jgi:acyl-coenzyme A thioesterase PaaI-like protein
MNPPAVQDLIPRNHCWGCGPDNAQGLQLKSYVDGDDLIATWQPGPPFFAGPAHVLNGGIIAALIDCHSVCTAIADVYRSENRAIGQPPDVWCATASLSINYRRPVPLDRPLELRASVSARDGRRTTVQCSLSSGDRECASGEAIAVLVPESWRQAPPQTRS